MSQSPEDNKIQVNDIVVISEKSLFYPLDDDLYNPINSEGLVVWYEDDARSLPYEVRWPNGVKNFYSEEDLCLVKR